MMGPEQRRIGLEQGDLRRQVHPAQPPESLAAGDGQHRVPERATLIQALGRVEIGLFDKALDRHHRRGA
jgi:hypothetical protein